MSTIDQLPTSFKWLHEETTEGMDFNSVTAQASWYGPWKERKAFLTVVGNTPETVTYGGGVSVTRIVPLKYPEYDRVYAKSVKLVGFGSSRPDASGFGIEYDWAKITVDFSTYPYAFDGSMPMITEQMDTGLDLVTRPNTAYVFPSDGTLVDHDVGVPVTCSEIGLTFHRVPALNKALWASVAGRVNVTTFYDYAPGTVHYLGPATVVEQNIGGFFTYSVTHRFRWRSVPHNELMRPDGTGFEAVVQAGDADAFLLPEGELNLLYA